MQQYGLVRGTPSVDTRPGSFERRFWNAFAERGGTHLLAERFDYDAVDIWLDAAEPLVLADQSALIRRLLRRRRTATSTPLITAYEEQDPHYGRWTLSTLLYEEYGDFKIVNNSYIHINYPPTSRPPQEQRIHVCWGIGWEGATQPAPRENERWSKPAGSVLNAVLALVVDDWRGALAPLPVRFELHRLNPAAFESGTGQRRRRWRLLETKLPPPGAVAALFERVNYARTLSRWPQLENAKVGRSDWWVAFLFEADLRGLGFRREPSLHPGVAPSWYATISGLTREIEHVIVVPPEPAVASIYRVRPKGKGAILEPHRSARTTAVAVDDYLHLRVTALDLALNELSERMH